MSVYHFILSLSYFQVQKFSFLSFYKLIIISTFFFSNLIETFKSRQRCFFSSCFILNSFIGIKYRFLQFDNFLSHHIFHTSLFLSIFLFQQLLQASWNYFYCSELWFEFLAVKQVESLKLQSISLHLRIEQLNVIAISQGFTERSFFVTAGQAGIIFARLASCDSLSLSLHLCFRCHNCFLMRTGLVFSILSRKL